MARSGRNIRCVIADDAYDGEPVYAAIRRGETGAVATEDRYSAEDAIDPNQGDLHGGSERECHAAAIARHGRMTWQKRHGYGKRALVETAISRIKRSNDGKLTSKTFGAQQNEIAIHVSIANRQVLIARPRSEKVS